MEHTVYDLQAFLELLDIIAQENIKIRIYSNWIIGLNISIFILLIVITFAIFFSNYNK